MRPKVDLPAPDGPSMAIIIRQWAVGSGQWAVKSSFVFAANRSLPTAHCFSHLAQDDLNVRARNVAMCDHADVRTEGACQNVVLLETRADFGRRFSGLHNIKDDDVVTTRSGSILMPSISANPSARRRALAWS